MEFIIVILFGRKDRQPYFVSISQTTKSDVWNVHTRMSHKIFVSHLINNLSQCCFSYYNILLITDISLLFNNSEICQFIDERSPNSKP